MRIGLPLSAGVLVVLGLCLQRPQPGRAQSPNPAGAGATRDAVRMAERIDECLAASWAAEGVEPAPAADDAEFMRRVYLDLVGVIPTVAEARSFLDDADTTKRRKLIDRLLGSHLRVEHLATTWRNMLVPRGSAVDGVDGMAGLQNWLRAQFAKNARYDQMVADLMVATGAAQDGPGLFYTAFDLKPEELAANTARVFLGIQIECAQCHDHPFDRWTQRDFWGYAAFFARLARPNANEPGRTMRLVDRPTGEVMLPNTQNVVLPKYPRGDESDTRETGTRRMQLGIWMVSRDNPFVHRAAVNRVWALLFGRGLVEPVDDLGDHNRPSHPQLFDELAAYFADTDYDLRHLLRTLTLTKAYQLTSQVTDDDSPRPELFARMPVKALSAEQLYDCLVRAGLLGSAKSEDRRSGSFDVGRQAFVAKMQSQARSRLDYDAGVAQVLLLVNGPEVAASTGAAASGLLAALEAPVFSPPERIEIVFLATVSRRPSAEEMARCVAHLAQGESADAAREALADILWALVNSAEFSLNH